MGCYGGTGEIRLTLTVGATSIALSPDGKTIATGGRDALYLWDTITGEHRATLAEHGDWVEDMRSAPDGSMIAVGNQNNTVRLWDARTGAYKLTLPSGHAEPAPATLTAAFWLCLQPGC